MAAGIVPPAECANAGGPDRVARPDRRPDRRMDQLPFRNMIVLAEAETTNSDCLVHSPICQTAWVVICGDTDAEFGRFRSLAEALETIRPLHVPTIMPPPDAVKRAMRRADFTYGS